GNDDRIARPLRLLDPVADDVRNTSVREFELVTGVAVVVDEPVADDPVLARARFQQVTDTRAVRPAVAYREAIDQADVQVVIPVITIRRAAELAALDCQAGRSVVSGQQTHLVVEKTR